MGSGYAVNDVLLSSMIHYSRSTMLSQQKNRSLAAGNNIVDKKADAYRGNSLVSR